jgi:hypothetical protein
MSPKWTDLIGRAGFDTETSIPDPTLSLNAETKRGQPGGMVNPHRLTMYMLERFAAASPAKLPPASTARLYQAAAAW